jgi:hypothetical protein
LAGASGVAALHHEVLHDAMEDGAMVEALHAELHKVTHSLATKSKKQKTHIVSVSLSGTYCLLSSALRKSPPSTHTNTDPKPSL